MKFAQPLWLLAGLIACARARLGAIGGSMPANARSWRSSPRAVSSRNSPPRLSPARRQLKRGLFIAGSRLPGPRAGPAASRFPLGGSQTQGLDVMFAVDTSKSMLAQDVKPDRLTRAKIAVEDLLGND